MGILRNPVNPPMNAFPIPLPDMVRVKIIRKTGLNRLG
jgi:hypothetical protein